jgi:large subunit ribosomal protein L24e
MTKCVFCGSEENPFKGVHLIKNDGSVNFFCSSKCRKNAIKLNRDKKKLKWTQAYREQKDRLVQQKVYVAQKAVETKQANVDKAAAATAKKDKKASK